MVDVNVDFMLKQNQLKEVWFELTKKMFKNFLYYEVLDLVLKASEEKDIKKYKKLNKFIKSQARLLIDKKYTISKIAKEYNIKIKGDKMVCPFHDDKDPSLSFDDSKNVFNCFGCHAKGDIIEFKRRLIESGVKKRS